MAKTKVSEWSSTAASNTDIDSINIAEGCAPSGINDAIRELMSQIKDFQAGTAGDSFNGPVGTSTAAAGAFTTLTTSSTVTHNGGTANGVAYLNGSKVLTTGSGLVFDGSNLGLGVTPSAWGSAVKALQFDYGAFSASSSIGTEVDGNCFYNGTNWIYRLNGKAFRYNQADAGHSWYNAASGTAGNAITFTQAMTLDASGNLGVGTTSPSTRLHVAGATTATSQVTTQHTGSSITTVFGCDGGIDVGAVYVTTNHPLVFKTNNTERARIDSSGNFLVGTTTSKGKLTVQGQAAIGSTNSTPNGIYLYINDTLTDNSYLSRNSNGSGTTTWYIGNQAITTSSDARLKGNVKPSERNAIGLLNQWEIVDHTWNDPSDQCESNRNSRGVWTGVIAQQVQPITPWLVNKPSEDVNEDGTINPWTMDFGYAVPLLVKAIQEQQAIINAQQAALDSLKARLDAANL